MCVCVCVSVCVCDIYIRDYSICTLTKDKPLLLDGERLRKTTHTLYVVGYCSFYTYLFIFIFTLSFHVYNTCMFIFTIYVFSCSFILFCNIQSNLKSESDSLYVFTYWTSKADSDPLLLQGKGQVGAGEYPHTGQAQLPAGIQYCF